MLLEISGLQATQLLSWANLLTSLKVDKHLVHLLEQASKIARWNFSRF